MSSQMMWQTLLIEIVVAILCLTLCVGALLMLVKKYPTISFHSTNVEHIDGTVYTVTGDLTLIGVTKLIIFDVEYSGQSAGSDTCVSLTAKATINRHDFGLGRSMRVQSATGKTATIEIALVAIRKSVKVPEIVAELNS